MYYRDMNELAQGTESAVTDALGWLSVFSDADDDTSVVEALESVAHFLQVASSDLSAYATDVFEVPENEWGEVDHVNFKEHGIRPQRTKVLAPEYQPQLDFANKLYALHLEVEGLSQSDGLTLEAALQHHFASFDCTLIELHDKLDEAFKQVAPAYEEAEEYFSGPGFDYHPKA